MSTVELGKGVILKGKDNLKYIRISERKEDFNRKFSFNCRCLIGKHFGQAFRIQHNGELIEIDPAQVAGDADDFLPENKNPDGDDGGGGRKDNRNIEDISDLQNQKLKKEDIQTMEKEGVTGTEIIRGLVDNSSTFNERTEFSKAKYVEKKKKKYVPQFLVLKPTARHLSEMYFFKNAQKVQDMRPDTLAQILIRGNVQSDSRVLVFDTCQGLVCGAVVERLGDGGKIVQLYNSNFPVRLIMEQFNFDAERMKANVCGLTVDKLGVLQKLIDMDKSDDDIIKMMYGRFALVVNDDVITEQMDVDKPPPPPTESAPEEEKKPLQGNNGVEEDKKKPLQGKNKRKFEKNKGKNRQHPGDRVAFISKDQRVRECREALSHFREQNFTSLIIVSKFHPKNVLLTLLAFLPPSYPFVVYFPYKEPLMECYVLLRELKVAACVELTEVFYRTLQVLPNRTHPQNMMSGSGGYILHGVKVVP